MAETRLEGQAAIDLWLAGKDQWNRWVDENPVADVDFSRTSFTNSADASGYGQAILSFEEFHFPTGDISFNGSGFGTKNVSFENAVFRDGKVSFVGTKFGDGEISFLNTDFGKGEISFERSIFGISSVTFENAKFHNGRVGFERCEFNGIVIFREADFGDGSVSFEFAKFNGKRVLFQKVNFGQGLTCFAASRFRSELVDFSEAIFKAGNVDFSNVNFQTARLLFANTNFGDGNTSFIRSNFKDGDIHFKGSIFGKGYLSFFQAMFGEGLVSFDNATLGEGDFSLEEIHSDAVVNFSNLASADETSMFSLRHGNFNQSLMLPESKLGCVLDLRNTKTDKQVTLHELEITLKRPRQSWKKLWTRKVSDPEDASRLRRLKEIAESNRDHAQALSFHADEMRAKRWGEIGIFASVLDAAFDALSNYGQSIWRPLFGLIILITLLTDIYARFAGANRIDMIKFTVANSLPFLISSRQFSIDSMKTLFGDPVPDYISFLTMGQGVLTVIFLFLIGLGLRNRFRI
jgi:hypothetical protein